MFSVLERIRESLTQQKSDVTPELLLDCVWLAISIRRESRELSSAPPNQKKIASEDSDDIEVASEAGSKSLDSDSPQGCSDQQRTSNDATGDNAAAIVASGTGDDHQMRGTHIALPSAPTLSHMLEIERALRGLRRRVLSKHRFSVSVEETTNWIAETGCLRIITKPQSERFLNGYVVIDHSPTMRFWQEPLREFRRLLWRLGAFKSLTTLHLNSFSDTPRLYADASFACPLNPSGITKHVGMQNLLLFCTDAHSPSWRSGGTDEFLNSFHCNANVVVVNVLDSNAWRRTALAKAQFATATNRRNSLRSLASPSLLENSSIAKDGLRPIVSLTPKSLSRLASFLYGESGNQITSYIIRESQGKLSGQSNTIWQPTEQAAEVAYKTFCDMASPSTIRLARSLACMPLFLPIMRLVRQVMHPETELHQLSEIFNSGMLHRREYSQPISDETDPDEIEYDFMPGLRERFLDNTSFMRIARCTELLDQYINSRFGQSNTFAAILRDPSKAEEWPTGGVRHNQASFARVFSNVLKRLGGSYADAASRLEPTAITVFEEPQPIESTPTQQSDLLTIEEIHQEVRASGMLEKDETVASELLLYDNYSPRQHTWLVTTETRVLIVLDDEQTRASNRRIQRAMNKDEILPLSFGPEDECTVGFAEKPNPKWYYSNELFPTQQSLREAIARLIQLSPDENSHAIESSPVTDVPFSVPESPVETESEELEHGDLQQSDSFSDIELEDGTNIRQGTAYVEKPDSWPTDLYIPSKASGSEGWADRLRRLQREFTRIFKTEDRVSCRITQRLIPQFPSARHSNSWLNESQESMFQGGGGLSRDFCRLEGPNGEWLSAEFPFADVTGASIQNSAGQPYAFRYGLSRSTFLLRDAKRRVTNPGIRDALIEGTSILYELPPNLATHIWANWETGFSRERNLDEYLWLNALFEIGWKKSPSRKLRLSRFAWSGIGRSMVELPNGPLFPRLPASKRLHESIGTEIPHYMGYPVEIFSEIQDVAQYSVAAIDHLLSLTGKEFDVYVCHSSRDKDIAKELVDRLSASGLKTFVHRAGFQPSEDFSEIAQRAASVCNLFLVVATESFVSSASHMHELDIAFDLQRKDSSLKIAALTPESSRPVTETEPRLNSIQFFSLKEGWHEVVDRIHLLLSDDQSNTTQNAGVERDLVVEFKRIDSVSVQKLVDWVKGRTFSNIRRSNVQVLLHRDLTAWLSYCRDYENSREWLDLPAETREQVQNLTHQILVKDIPGIRRGIEIILRDFQGDDWRRLAEIVRQFVEAKVVAILRVLYSIRCVGMKPAPWHKKYENMSPHHSTDIMAGLVVTCTLNKSEICYWTEADIYLNGKNTGRRAFVPFNLILRKKLNQPFHRKDIDLFLTPQFVDQELWSQDSISGNEPIDSTFDFVDRHEGFWTTEEFEYSKRDSEMLASIRRAATSVYQQWGFLTLMQFSGDSKSWSQVVSELNTSDASSERDDVPMPLLFNDSESSIEGLVGQFPFVGAEDTLNWCHLAKQRICRVIVGTSMEAEESTGFLVGDDLVLTCYHGIRRFIDRPADIKVSFDDDPSFIPLDLNWKIVHSSYSEDALRDSNLQPNSSQLDFAVLRLAESVGTTRGYFKIDGHQQPSYGETIFVAGYHGKKPPLERVQFSCAAPGFMGLNENGTRIQYRASLGNGASGSPVFDSSFRVIGMHQGRVKETQLDKDKDEGVLRRGIPVNLISQEFRTLQKVSIFGQSDIQLEEREKSMTTQEIVDWLASAPSALTGRIVFNLGAGADLPQNVAPIQFAIAFVQWAIATDNSDALRSEILKLRGQNVESQSPPASTAGSQLITARHLQKAGGVDVFLCHSSEDKESVVRPLAQALENAGIRCWTDEGQIQWGDSISRKINDGLAAAKFVIVVVSESFLQKEWPLTELSSAFNREMTERRTHVLPLFVCGRDQAIQRLPLLRDKLSLTWAGNTSSIVAALSSLLVDLPPDVSAS